MPLHNHSAPSKSGLAQHDRRFRTLPSSMYLLLISLVWMLEERARNGTETSARESAVWFGLRGLNSLRMIP